MHKLKYVIDKLDIACFSFFNKIYKEKEAKFIDLITVTPVVFYILFIVVNYFFYQNKFSLDIFFIIISTLIVIIVKKFVKRKRPTITEGNRIHEVLEIGPDEYSFPSAHTYAMFVLVPISFLILSWIGGILFTLYAILIGYSRLYLRMHWLFDIEFAAVLGLIVGTIIIIF